MDANADWRRQPRTLSFNPRARDGREASKENKHE